MDISVNKHGFRLKDICFGRGKLFAELQTEPCWQIEFRDNSRNSENAIIIDEIETKNFICLLSEPLVYKWDNIDLGDEREVLDIIVQYASGEYPEWRIQVKNRSKKYGIWRVNFH